MSTQFQQTFTTAIALNNAGVSLLRRHCYRQANDAFNDALKVMRDLSTPCQARQHSSDLLNSMLQKAYSDVFESQRYSQTDDATFRIVTEEESTDVIVAGMQQPSYMAFSTIFLIRIELEGKSIQECQSEDLDVQSAIILYNYGVVYKCLASTEPRTELAIQPLRRASKLFSLSYSILQKLMPKADCQGSAEDLSLSILALCGLASCACMLGMEKDKMECYSTMLIFQEYLREEEECFNISPFAAASA